ncbi:DUF6111 family protein [Neomegalonema sp.]|uniref:DUF6111 family protein n=1 Tax=Neomegalonema sp. TaxID=2039713 RepID=UPI00260AC2F7|nr:DUF6111 family protein [Neomegalonema sp.]MDD2868699.1 DUF6111 family protein [Neomegalonema sp.]
MGRILILILALGCLPFALAALYEWSRDRGGWRRRGLWARERLLRLALLGLLLAAAGSLAMAIVMDPGGETGRYEPARLENGRVTPGRIVPEELQPQSR